MKAVGLILFLFLNLFWVRGLSFFVFPFHHLVLSQTENILLALSF